MELENPVRSFEENVLTESMSVDLDSTFIQNSNTLEILNWLTNEVGISLRNIIFVNMDASKQRICTRLEDSLRVNLDSSAFAENETIEINSATRQKLAEHFYQQNVKLKKYTGINYNE